MSRAKDIAARIAFPGVWFEVLKEDGREFLRVRCDDATCNVSGKAQGWKGRLWRLSPHMTDMEVVQTAFLAILTAQEHEAREQFKVDGVALLDSHRDLDQVLRFMCDGGGGHGRDEPHCQSCGYPRSNHPFRHVFVGAGK